MKLNFFRLLAVLTLLCVGVAAPARAAGISPQIAQSAVNSDAFGAFYVKTVATKLLGRAATSAEAAPLVAQLQSGGDGWIQVVTTVAGSPAYFQKTGSTNEKFVPRLFADMVGRAPDATEELPASIDFLKTGQRGELAAVLADTDEFRANFAALFYQALLKRAPNATETAKAVSQLQTGGIGALGAALLGSAEYFGKAGNSQNGWQSAINRDLGGAQGVLIDDINTTEPAPSPAPAPMELPQPSVGMPVNGARAPLVQAMLDSPDYAKNVVESYYQKFLHRAPTPTELQIGIAVQSGGDIEQLLLGILTSDEYYNRAGGTTTTFLNRLSQDLLGQKVGKNGFPSKNDLLDLLKNKLGK